MTAARHLITRLHGGYIAWRGRSVEHFSYREPEQFEEAATRLAEHCELLEAKGFPVTSRTCMFRPLFRQAPAGTPWLETMTSYYTVLADGTGRARRCILALPGHAAVAIGIDHGQLVMDYAYETEAAFGTTNLLHELQQQGFVSCGASDCSYDRLVELFAEAGLTPDLVRAVLATPVPEQPEQPAAEAPA